MPYFAKEQLSGLIETDRDSNGTVHFAQEGTASGDCRDVCVLRLSWSTNETMFSQQKEAVKERIG